LVDRGAPPVTGEDGHRVRDGLQLPTECPDGGPDRSNGMIEPLIRTVSAHRGHSHADEEGSEQDRAEHHHQKGSSQSAT
jgi:hypothetical protein